MTKVINHNDSYHKQLMLLKVILKKNKMSVIIILLIVSVCIAGGFLLAFLWSVSDGQFEDEFSAANRILFDDTILNNKPTK